MGCVHRGVAVSRASERPGVAEPSGAVRTRGPHRGVVRKGMGKGQMHVTWTFMGKAIENHGFLYLFVGRK